MGPVFRLRPCGLNRSSSGVATYLTNRSSTTSPVLERDENLIFRGAPNSLQELQHDHHHSNRCRAREYGILRVKGLDYGPHRMLRNVLGLNVKSLEFELPSPCLVAFGTPFTECQVVWPKAPKAPKSSFMKSSFKTAPWPEKTVKQHCLN